jgi:hypothetical protein
MAKRSSYGISQKKLKPKPKIPDLKINTKKQTGNDIGARENEEWCYKRQE